MLFGQVAITFFVFVSVCYHVVTGRHFFEDDKDNRCITPTRKPGLCEPLHTCPTLLNAFKMNVATLDKQARQYLERALCRYERAIPIVCCEIDAGACVTPEKKPGACVHLKRCDPLLTYIEKKPFIDEEKVRYLKHSECVYGDDQLSRVCCPIFRTNITGVIADGITTVAPINLATTLNSSPTPSTKPNPSTSPSSKPTPAPSSESTPTLPTSTITVPIPSPTPIQNRFKVKLPSPGEGKGHCGSQEFQNRIIGGNVTDIYEYPWMALIKYGDGQLGCGGSLINERYVLTAAHCVTGPKVVEHRNLSSIRLGEWDTDDEEDCVHREEGYDECTDPPLNILAEKIIPHAGFSLQTLQNDIALVRLSEPAPYTEFIRPICLPINKMEIPALLRVSGWGATESERSSNIKLHLTKLPLFDKEKCAALYGRSTNPKINIGPGQFCAGGLEAQDSCSGDSGGPLMITQKVAGVSSLFYQLGIVSFGPAICGILDRPAVYTKVDEYMDWILENMEP